jgi:histidinol-phosphate/aromatic aminotransferase/cobyric acid decarboxylase-like protein
MIEIKVYVHLAGTDELRGLEHSLAHLNMIANEVLQAVVTDPAKLAEVTEKLKASSERLQAALQSASPVVPPQP